MKKLFFCMAGAVMFAGCAPKQTYRMTGNVEGLEGWPYLEFGPDNKDGILVENGTFVYKKRMGRPTAIQFENGKGLSFRTRFHNRGNTFPAFIFPLLTI